jgi:chromosome segregation ATPase
MCVPCHDRADADAQVHDVAEEVSKAQTERTEAEQLLRARIGEVGSQLEAEEAQRRDAQKDASGRLGRHDGLLAELEKRVNGTKSDLAQLAERVDPLPAAQAALADELRVARDKAEQACAALGKRVEQEAEFSANSARKAAEELRRADAAIRELQADAKQAEQQQVQLSARVGEVGAQVEPMKRTLASLGKAVETSEERSAKAAQATAAQLDALKVTPPMTPSSQGQRAAHAHLHLCPASLMARGRNRNRALVT